MVGDSHLQGLDRPMRSALRARGYTHAGTVARQGWNLRRFEVADDLTAVLRPMRPDVVIVVLGSNDYGVRSEARYLPRLTWLATAARRAGARRIVWIGPGAVDDRPALARTAATHDRVAELQSSILPRLGVDWVDSRAVTRGRLRSDGLHLTPRGYHDWASAVVGEMEACGAGH